MKYVTIANTISLLRSVAFVCANTQLYEALPPRAVSIPLILMYKWNGRLRVKWSCINAGKIKLKVNSGAMIL